MFPELIHVSPSLLPASRPSGTAPLAWTTAVASSPALHSPVLTCSVTGQQTTATPGSCRLIHLTLHALPMLPPFSRQSTLLGLLQSPQERTSLLGTSLANSAGDSLGSERSLFRPGSLPPPSLNLISGRGHPPPRALFLRERLTSCNYVCTCVSFGVSLSPTRL